MQTENNYPKTFKKRFSAFLLKSVSKRSLTESSLRESEKETCVGGLR